MKVLFIRSPRYYWPVIGEQDNFWQPIAYASLAAVLRDNDYTVRIIDCPVKKIGWKTLRRLLEKESPSVVAFGDYTPSVHESRRLARLCKEIDDNIITIAGGQHFTFYVEELKKAPIDFIVRFEGEETLLELINEINKPSRKQNFSKIKGIAFLKNGKIQKSPPREAIQNLDSLPIPAFDLLPMEYYGDSPNFPKMGAMEHSRGCVGNCKFCCLWQDRDNAKHGLWRTKSVDRTLEEMEILIKKYNKKMINFVDNTFNVNHSWNREFAEKVIQNNWDIEYFSFLRADFALRDFYSGTLKKMVDAGLSHTVIGVERNTIEGLRKINKGQTPEIVKKAVNAIKSFNKTFVVGTVYIGVEEETYQSMMDIVDFCIELDIDLMAPLPVTPLPGTPLWEEYLKKRLITNYDFRYYDFYTPVARSDNMSSREIKKAQQDMMKKWFSRPKYLLRCLLHKDKGIRNRYMVHTKQGIKIPLWIMQKKLFPKFWKSKGRFEAMGFMKRPDWYET